MMRQLWCRREITQLGQEALHVSELQDKLLKKLDLLESHQGEIYKTLTTVEEEAGKMFDDEEPFRDPLETKRINLYERAIKVSEQLNQCVSLLNSSACLARVLLCNGCLQMVERTTAHSTGAV
jgi:hypothetical protein